VKWSWTRGWASSHLCTAGALCADRLSHKSESDLWDNYATHKTPVIKEWLIKHPRFHLHFTPTSSSWLNLVERWFAELTNRKLRRSAHRSVTELETDIRKWINEWNKDPGRSSGPNPPTRSSKHSPPTANASSTQDVRSRPSPARP